MKGIWAKLILLFLVASIVIFNPSPSMQSIADSTVDAGYIWSRIRGELDYLEVSALAWDGTYLYAGTIGRGIWRYDKETGEFTCITINADVTGTGSLIWDGYNLYASSSGVWCYDPSTGSWADTGGGVSGLIMEGLAWDGSTLYAGTRDNGIWRYNPSTGIWTNAGGGVTYVESLTWGGSCLYVGVPGSVLSYNPDTGIWTDIGEGFADTSAYSLAWGGSVLYAGTGLDGVWCYSPASNSWSNTGGSISEYGIHSLVWDGSRIYAGANFNGRGIWRYDPATETWVSAGGKLRNTGISSLAMCGSDLYVGTADDGLYTWPPVWYLAEGSTMGGMETFVSVQNPDDTDTHVNINFQTDEGKVAPEKLQNVAIPARSRATFKVNDYTTTFDVSSMVEALDGNVICERAVYGNNRTWAHDSIGTTMPAEQWFLTEGSTQGGMETYVLVQNPWNRTVCVDVEFYTDNGKHSPEQLQGVELPACSRTTFKVNDYVTTYDVSTLVNADGGNVICERAMYGNNRTWAHDSIGLTYLADTWYLAEGSTDGGMETYILVQNAMSADTYVKIELQTDKGEEDKRSFYEKVPAYGRASIRLNDVLTSYNVSTKVTVDTSASFVVCERAMYGNNRTWAHDSVGTFYREPVWYLAEGCTDGGMETFVLVQNPYYLDTHVNVTFLTDKGEIAPPELQGVLIPKYSRCTFKANDYVTTYNVSTKVEAIEGKVICERAMYGNNRTWGTDSIGYSPTSER